MTKWLKRGHFKVFSKYSKSAYVDKILPHLQKWLIYALSEISKEDLHCVTCKFVGLQACLLFASSLDV